MENRRVPIHRLAVRVKSTPRGRRRSPTSRRSLLFEALEDRTLLSSGQLDPTFGYQGVESAPITGDGSTIALDSEGRILATGTSLAGSLFQLARYTANGQPDLSFGNLGLSTYQPSRAASVSPSSRMVRLSP
jgi:Domain of unknown function (DUF5122) beta-propeller